MLIEQRLTVAAPLERVWAFMLDIPAVSSCVPGLEDVSSISEDEYAGALRVKVGPIQLRLAGRITLQERDDAAHAARMRLEAADKRVGGAVNASMRMQLPANGA